MKRHPTACLFALGLLALNCAAACPADPEAPQGTALSIRMPGQAPVRLRAQELDAYAPRTLTQRRTVEAHGASAAPAVEQSVAYSGVLVRDAIARLPAYDKLGRAQRWLAFETVATDGYRAVISWGELFNTNAGEKILIVRAQDGRPLDDALGPLALRALGDTNLGPRHVRNLCAVVVHAYQ